MTTYPDIALDLTLRDGGPVHLRPIVPEDRDAIAAALGKLSDTSRYRRFFEVRQRFTGSELRYLTQIDYHDHFAWAALDPTEPEPEGLGVGRYVRVADEPEVAEPALTISDAHQGRGLGTILLAVLAHTAKAHGITRFRGDVLAGNHAMVDVFEHLGGYNTGTRQGVSTFELQLDVEPPDTPAGRVFREIGALLAPILARAG